MLQSTRFLNLSPRVRSSTAMMSVSPRAFRPFTRLDPMNPAAPVTTTYKRLLLGRTRPSGRACGFADFEAHARRDGAQKLVADGAGCIGHFVHRQAFAPQHDVAADA